MTNKTTRIDDSQIKVIWFYGMALLVSVGIAVYYDAANSNPEPQYMVRSFQLQKGYGYDVLLDGNVIIHQEFMPTVHGCVNFSTAGTAIQVGRLVVKKLINGDIPEISHQALVQLGVIHK